MFAELIKKIDETALVANEALDEESFPATLAARRGRKNQAAEMLRMLEVEYYREMIRSAVFIVVTGSEAEKFVAVAEQSFNTFGANANDLFNELASKVNDNLLAGRESTKYVFDLLKQLVEVKAGELGMLEYSQLNFKDTYDNPMSTRQDVADLAFTAINEQIGGEIVGINALHGIVNKAIAAKHASRFTPVAIVADETVALTLSNDLRRLTPRTYLVVAGKAGSNLKDVADVTTSVAIAPKAKRQKGQSDEEYAAQLETAEKTEINPKAVEDALMKITKSLAK